MDDPWNRCDVCGRFIAMSDFATGAAVRQMTRPDSEYSSETYETLCPRHAVGHPSLEEEGS